MNAQQPYAGTIDETAISASITDITDLIVEAGEVGFVLTYHAVDEAGTSGVMDLVGRGITREQLGILFATALDHSDATA